MKEEQNERKVGRTKRNTKIRSNKEEKGDLRRQKKHERNERWRIKEKPS